ncbi:S8 family serine peptidase [Pontibacter amylolyticus]|uniref:Peptidase S8 n=1 Tax=Pontibacter amylolyticus TaxID=1424080 RepID=A0ABQ1W6R6_9BACT|nr:S8 family serine peptidase [Pontibacter amylolyticus]GGG16191.1 peptidase S8 [Pontibacter amylolyticus]
MTNKFFTRNNLLVAAAFAFLGLTGCNPEEDVNPDGVLSASETNEAVAAAASGVKYRGNHYIVLSNTETLPAGLGNQLASINGRMTNIWSEAGVATVYSEDPAFLAKASRIQGVRSVVRDLEIQWIKPDSREVVLHEEVYGNPPNSGDNDTRFDLQWGHAAIKAPAAWNAGVRGKGVKVAVLDSGFDLDHPDLAPNILMNDSKSFVVNDKNEDLWYALDDAFSHGTHTAGTIAAADNAYGVIGVAPEAKLILVKVLSDHTGSGAFSWIMAGIVHAADKGADVINMSLGAAIPRNGWFVNDNGTPTNPSDDYLEKGSTSAVQELLIALDRTTQYANKKGVTVVASAGNAANNGNKDGSLVHVPSASSQVISVSATAPFGWALNPYGVFMDNFASYSNYGTPDIHFAAPGGDSRFAREPQGFQPVKIGPVTQVAYAFDLVYSTGNTRVPNAGAFYWSAGTSMASPHAAGVAALIISKNGDKMDPAQVLAKMRDTADDLGKPGRDPYYGYGRVNALRAVTE